MTQDKFNWTSLRKSCLGGSKPSENSPVMSFTDVTCFLWRKTGFVVIFLISGECRNLPDWQAHTPTILAYTPLLLILLIHGTTHRTKEWNYWPIRPHRTPQSESIANPVSSHQTGRLTVQRAGVFWVSVVGLIWGTVGVLGVARCWVGGGRNVRGLQVNTLWSVYCIPVNSISLFFLWNAVEYIIEKTNYLTCWRKLLLWDMFFRFYW